MVDKQPKPEPQPVVEAITHEPEIELPEVNHEQLQDVHDNALEAELAQRMSYEDTEELVENGKTTDYAETLQPELIEEVRPTAREIELSLAGEPTESSVQMEPDDELASETEERLVEMVMPEPDNVLPLIEHEAGREAVTTLDPAAQAWETTLHKTPDELYEDFIQALQLFAENVAEQIESMEAEEDTQDLLPIISSVSEHLAELREEERESVSFTLQSVIGALHGLQVLEMRGAQAADIEEVERQLAAFTATLFESLEMEYSDQDIEDFVAVLRHPAFKPEAVVEYSVDLKDLGTHEAKYFARMVSNLAQTESHIQHAIGMFVLRNLGLRTGASVKEAA